MNSLWFWSPFQESFNDEYDEYRKKWGGGNMGSKRKKKANERVLAKDAAQRMTQEFC